MNLVSVVITVSGRIVRVLFGWEVSRRRLWSWQSRVVVLLIMLIEFTLLLLILGTVEEPNDEPNDKSHDDKNTEDDDQSNSPSITVMPISILATSIGAASDVLVAPFDDRVRTVCNSINAVIERRIDCINLLSNESASDEAVGCEEV